MGMKKVPRGGFMTSSNEKIADYLDTLFKLTPDFKDTFEKRYRILKMIGEEDKTKPISDQKITDNLEEYGINCSRRTIAKYRKAIGVRSSRKRKRF